MNDQQALPWAGRVSPGSALRRALCSCFLLISALIAPFFSFSQAVRAGTVEAELIAQSTSVKPGTPFLLGIRFHMDPDWHIYWKYPGDTGLPTTVAWDMPRGFAAGPLMWPAPKRIVAQGIASYGYDGYVTLAAEITPPPDLKPGSRVTLRARATWLACRIECTPGKADLALSLPVEDRPPLSDATWSQAFREAKARLPSALPAGAVKAARVSGTLTLEVRGIASGQASEAWFLPDAAGVVSDSAPQKAVISGGTVKLDLMPPAGVGGSGGAAPAARLTGVLLLQDKEESRGFDIDAAIFPQAAPGAAAAGWTAPAGGVAAGGTTLGLLAALALAFLGGLILNLMPCVLPVVSLKVLSFVRHSSQGSALRQGILFAAGVMASFWLIAGILIALRAGGQLIGWGFQFQSPVVVTITTSLFFLIALNLLGVFELGTAFASAAGGLGRKQTSLGSFLNGLLATAVATPCTAPFMGTALGFALTQPPAASLGVFTALGLGMAAPYIVLSALPGLISRIPKPGPWMETLRQVLAFPMLGAVVWMLWVLETLSGMQAMPVLLSMLLAAALGAWIYGKWGRMSSRRSSRIAAGALAVTLVVGGTAAAIVAAGAPAPAQSQPASSSSWEPWSPDRQAALLEQGVPVFVDFSARWCLTCQVNERIALENPSVVRKFRELNVATLRADWTDRNDTIARALAGFGRAGVPLYVLYRRGSTAPVLLPELLTPAVVLDALSEPD